MARPVVYKRDLPGTSQCNFVALPDFLPFLLSLLLTELLSMKKLTYQSFILGYATYNQSTFHQHWLLPSNLVQRSLRRIFPAFFTPKMIKTRPEQSTPENSKKHPSRNPRPRNQNPRSRIHLPYGFNPGSKVCSITWPSFACIVLSCCLLIVVLIEYLPMA